MAVASDIERLKREVDTLAAAVELNLKPNAKTALTSRQRQALRSEIERCMQRLDELRNRLST